MVKINISKIIISPKHLDGSMCQISMDEWKKVSTWRYFCSYKLVALKLHNSYSYIVIIELHELHMYTISHMVSYIHCNSCNLSNNIHACRNTLICNELQMVFTTPKPNCKANCKSPSFLIMIAWLTLIIIMGGSTIKYTLPDLCQKNVK
jgi:hypothetical protein